MTFDEWFIKLCRENGTWYYQFEEVMKIAWEAGQENCPEEHESYPVTGYIQPPYFLGG